ncbi:hypothetical protein G7A66_01520 [Altererythrobacter sp. SALINAS58]|uniref:hypothetical protein n=1 Tax=Alteripontixanthobacter muriae TaxID=2705546 RepID=UPI001576D0BE|nr:hypothetical protein [Alteripontixanthobacter muriae]NTZ41786.1 hypothetical protein [Alteripontixanthobacter muriae]
MEYEISDDPQGCEPNTPDYDDDSEVTENHRALKNQSSIRPEEYPAAVRADQSLVNPAKKKR